MECEDYREKYIHENLTKEEQAKFIEHLENCTECRTFVENYNQMKEFIRIRTEFRSSSNLKNKIVSRVKFKNTTKRIFKVALPVAVVVILSTFYVMSPFSARHVIYEKVASTGIEMLNSNHATPVNSLSNLDYLVKIKYASDQF